MPSPIVSTFLPIITLATLLLLNNALLAIAFTWNVSPSISTVSGILKFTGLFNAYEYSTLFISPAFSVTVYIALPICQIVPGSDTTGSSGTGVSAGSSVGAGVGDGVTDGEGEGELTMHKTHP